MAEPLRRVGRYELIEVIGRGGTAVVYLAKQPDLDRLVALKELSPHHAGDPRFAARFVEESRLVAALNHPNIVTVHEYFEEDGLPYIAMEYLPRGSLRPYLSTLSLPQIFGVAENVLAALGHGEDHHIIHRDLKPENLLVSGDGQVKISDYGVARALDSIGQRSFATMTGTTIGTPAYMAPEQALGEQLGPEADIYALGVIIWEALAGRPPFGSADTPMAVLYQKIHEPVPRIQELEPDVDPGLAGWLDVTLAKTSGARFSSASQAWNELEDVAIKLLGPRWRRDARINLEVVESPHEVSEDPRLADTETGDRRRHARTPVTDGPVPEPPEPSAGEAPISPPRREAPESVAARAVEPAANETMMRLSRRHLGADDEAEDDSEEAPRRRWIAWSALGALIVVAAAIGVGLALATNPKAPRAGTRTQTTPATALAGAVRPILATLEAAQAKGLKKLDGERNSAGQESAARALQADYTAAAKALAGLPVAERQLPSYKALDGVVRGIALNWEKAAYAAKTTNTAGYQAARSAIEKAAPLLAGAAATAAGSATSTGTSSTARRTAGTASTGVSATTGTRTG